VDRSLSSPLSEVANTHATMSALFVATLTQLTYVLPGITMTHRHARVGPIYAFDDGQREETLQRGNMRETALWQQTTDNLLYKDLMVPEGEEAILPVADDIIAIAFTASYASGEVIESTGDRPLTFKLGDSSEPLFQEAIMGMVVGGKRRLKLAPDSKYASPAAKETILFEVELLGIQTGVDALVFKLLRNRSTLINAALLLSFAPDILGLLGLLGLLPAPNGAEQLNAAFSSGGFGAVDILSGAATSVASSAPVVVDAANQWAAQGLKGLF